MTAKKKKAASLTAPPSHAKRAAVMDSLVQPMRLELMSVSDLDGQTQLFQRITVIRDKVGALAPSLSVFGLSEDDLVAMARKLWDEYVVAYDFPRIPNLVEHYIESICWQWLEWSIRRLVPDDPMY